MFQVFLSGLLTASHARLVGLFLVKTALRHAKQHCTVFENLLNETFSSATPVVISMVQGFPV